MSSTDFFRAAISTSISFSFKSCLVFPSLHVTTPQTDMYSTSTSFPNLYSSKLRLANLPYSLSIRYESLLKQEVTKQDLIPFSYQICKIFDIVLFKHSMLFKESLSTSVLCGRAPRWRPFLLISKWRRLWVCRQSLADLVKTKKIKPIY